MIIRFALVYNIIFLSLLLKMTFPPLSIETIAKIFSLILSLVVVFLRIYKGIIFQSRKIKLNKKYYTIGETIKWTIRISDVFLWKKALVYIVCGLRNDVIMFESEFENIEETIKTESTICDIMSNPMPFEIPFIVQINKPNDFRYFLNIELMQAPWAPFLSSSFSYQREIFLDKKRWFWRFLSSECKEEKPFLHALILLCSVILFFVLLWIAVYVWLLFF